ncbi:MAG: DUF4838 domain-containing protein [Planctomycetota bacterium]|jgi:hypothetical protein
MNRRASMLLVSALSVGISSAPAFAAAIDVVRGGEPVATIVIDPAEATPGTRGRRGSQPSDQQAAQVLIDWVKKMTGAELPVARAAPDGKPIIYVGRAAVKAGLRLDAIESPSREGLRIQTDGQRLLVAGQSPTATVKAVCRLLEHWGCRYFIDHPLGEVYPRTKSLSLGDLDVSEKPGFLYRSIWGSQWSGSTLWKIWNGAGGTRLATGHAWGQYVAKDLFKENPDLFRLRDEKRQPSDWYCTSNPDLHEVFSRGVIRRIEGGVLHPSLSPPDGRGYCECGACRAQDDPDSVEPSSGHVSVTNRYVDFYQHVARQVARRHPESILSFYCYADYTQAPTNGIELEPSLCAWIAPIRYCRFHRIGHPDCPSRSQLGELLDGWASSAQRIAYRTYNYNLAECVVPFSLISVWKHDIPYLRRKGCIGVNLETLANWQIYGPHVYLSIRLAYDAEADADAVMDDFFMKFYGPGAGPHMKWYWAAIDRAFVELPCHSGSFFALHLVYTPAFLRRCRGMIDSAARAAGGDKACAARVQMAAEGLENAEQYVAVRGAINRGDFQAAKRVYDGLLARSEANRQSGLGNHYTVGYLKRFVGRQVDAAAAATAPPDKVVQILPDKWRLAYDEAEAGLEKGYHLPACDDSKWPEVATYSNPLDAQGMPDRQTVMWYRTAFSLPQLSGKHSLLFIEVDGDAEVYLNGKHAGRSEKKRQPFELDVGGAFQPGRNVVAVRVDHSNITELFLGGILRPVVLIRNAPETD